jgi:L-threonylcarbamoyladenylate synthase
MFDDIAQKLMQPGSVGVLPTDTVYGLVARANDEAAVKRLYELKHRENKPGTLIADRIEQLVSLGLKARYMKAVEQYWPGAISVIIPCGPELTYPDYPELLKLLEATGPLLTSSANNPGEPTANTADEARKYFGETVDFYVDGGDLSSHQSSTVIRIVDDAIEILREGAVKIQENE